MIIKERKRCSPPGSQRNGLDVQKLLQKQGFLQFRQVRLFHEEQKNSSDTAVETCEMYN